MSAVALVAGVLLTLATLLDGFETILLPRRINHRFRYSRLYYTTGWLLWRRVASAFPPGRWREGALGTFGPLSMIGLFVSWVGSLVLGFALVHCSILTVEAFAFRRNCFSGSAWGSLDAWPTRSTARERTRCTTSSTTWCG